MIEKGITGLLFLVGVIHFLPIVGLSGIERISSLYAIEITDGNLEILMRHRAALFGILGAFIIYAAFRPDLRPMAFIAAFFSIVTFFYLAFSVGDFNDAIRAAVVADVVASAALLGAITLYLVKNNA